MEGNACDDGPELEIGTVTPSTIASHRVKIDEDDEIIPTKDNFVPTLNLLAEVDMVTIGELFGIAMTRTESVSFRPSDEETVTDTLYSVDSANNDPFICTVIEVG